MTENKPQEKENMTQYYIVILLVVGFVTYKFFSEADKKQLINAASQVTMAIISILLLFAIMFFSAKGYLLQNDKSKRIAKILIHTTNFMIIASFVFVTVYFWKNIFSSFAYLILASITALIILYYNYAFHRTVVLLSQKKKTENEKHKQEQNELEKLLQTDFNKSSLEEVHHAKNKLEYFLLTESFKNYIKKTLKKIDEVKRVIIAKNDEKEIDNRLRAKELLEQEIKELEKNKLNEARNKEEIKESIKNQLDTYENDVYIKEDLSHEQIEILQDEGYKQTNEYDICEQRIVTALVQPVLNHSPTHTFLVWSARRFLDNYEGITKIETHETRDAGITFQYNRRNYAVEIETGNLLRKKKRLLEKVDYLKKKYNKRWFFLVSNRNLQASYKKFGFCTQRRDLNILLEKMLNN